MNKVIINSYKDFEGYSGKQIGVSDYIKVTQKRVDLFCNSICNNAEAKNLSENSPQQAIVPSYLLQALLPHLWNQIVEVNNIQMFINHSIEELKFNHPVVTNNDIRLIASLESIKNLRGISKAKISYSLEIKDCKENAMEGSVIFLYYFNE